MVYNKTKCAVTLTGCVSAEIISAHAGSKESEINDYIHLSLA